MATSGSQYIDITQVASTGLTGNQYYIVRSTGVDTTYSAGNLTTLLCTGSSGGASGPRGVLQNDPDTGQAAIVRVTGLTKVVVGGTVAVGDQATCSTAGQAISATTTGQWCIGRFESASTASGQVVTLRLEGGGWFYTAGATA